MPTKIARLLVHIDGEEQRSILYSVQHVLESPDPAELVLALRKAIHAYLATEEGRKVWAGNNEAFNWGDALSRIPDSHWSKFGVLTIEQDVDTPLAEVEHDDAFEPCDGCDGTGIRLDSPAHSGLPVPEGFTVLERCDECQLYPSDYQAAMAVGTDIQERKHPTAAVGSDTICRLKPKP